MLSSHLIKNTSTTVVCGTQNTHQSCTTVACGTQATRSNPAAHKL
jgi:hypothetical protein